MSALSDAVAALDAEVANVISTIGTNVTTLQAALDAANVALADAATHNTADDAALAQAQTDLAAALADAQAATDAITADTASLTTIAPMPVVEAPVDVPSDTPIADETAQVVPVETAPDSAPGWTP